MTTQHRRDVDDLASGRNDGWTEALLRDRLAEEASMHGFVGPDDGPEETVVSTKNEAAERLYATLHDEAKDESWEGDLKEFVREAITTERRNTVERIGHWIHHDPDCGWHRSDPEGCNCGLARAEFAIRDEVSGRG